MAKIKQPIVYDGVEHKHRELISGAEVVGGLDVQVSFDSDNALVVGTDGGLYVQEVDTSAIDPVKLISGDTPNSIILGSDNRLRVPPVQPLGLISSDVPNIIITGTDGKLLTRPVTVPTGADLISSDVPNTIVTGTDGKLLARPQAIPTAASLISDDTPNSIVTGTDGKLFSRTPRSQDFLSTDSGNRMTLGSIDSKLYVGSEPPAGFISANINNAITLGTDNKLFAPVVTPGGLVSSTGGNDLGLGTDGNLYINVSDALLIDGSDQILTKSVLGIRGHVRMNYLPATRVVQLLGKNDVLISSFALPEATLLESATIVTNPSGQPAGTYLALVFTTATGLETVYVNLDSLVVVYSAADTTINITGHAIKVQLDPNSPLGVSANGVTFTYAKAISTDTDNRLTLGTDGKLKTTHPALNTLISTNAGNSLTLGTDGLYFIPTPPTATAATSIAAGAAGMASYAADNDTTSRNKAATPAGVASQVAASASGKVDTTRSISTTAPLTGGGSLTADRTLAINAASAATPSYVIQRDTAGRAQIVAPAVTADIANKGYVDTAVAGVPTGTPPTRTIATTAPLLGGGDLSANRTLSITPAGAAGATTSGTVGSAVYAADNDTTSKDKAATPSNVAVQVAAGVATIPQGVPVTRIINTTAPLYGGGNLSADRTFYLGTIPISLGGTGATTAAAARTNLGITTGAPMPTTAAGVGQWTSSSSASLYISTPAGGTWAWVIPLTTSVSIDAIGIKLLTGVSAGGTNIYNSGSVQAYALFWRIA